MGVITQIAWILLLSFTLLLLGWFENTGSNLNSFFEAIFSLIKLICLLLVYLLGFFIVFSLVSSLISPKSSHRKRRHTPDFKKNKIVNETYSEYIHRKEIERSLEQLDKEIT